jgi:hypothetical protein
MPACYKHGFNYVTVDWRIEMIWENQERINMLVKDKRKTVAMLTSSYIKEEKWCWTARASKEPAFFPPS